MRCSATLGAPLFQPSLSTFLCRYLENLGNFQQDFLHPQQKKTQHPQQDFPPKVAAFLSDIPLNFLLPNRPPTCYRHSPKSSETEKGPETLFFFWPDENFWTSNQNLLILGNGNRSDR